MFNGRIFENFLNKKDCEYLIQTAIDLSLWSNSDNEFWDNRLTQYHDILKHDKRAGEIMLDVNNRCKEKIKAEYSLQIPIYSDTLQIVRWFPGTEQPPHADNMDFEGALEHDHKINKHRVFGSIIYLNSNYVGGNTYYPNFNFSIVPKSGSLAVHPADSKHLHGVTKIEDSIRYTIASFWTHDPLKCGFWNTVDYNK